jgi:hypothetical protein
LDVRGDFFGVKRRGYLTAVSTVGVVATAGCSSVGGQETLSEPTVKTESDGRKALIFTSDGEEVGHLGVNGNVESNLISLSTEIWHQEGTKVQSIKLRVWMPETAAEPAAEVAVVSPVEGDSSPPPSVAIYTPDQALGTVIEITDLDDLADETISTVKLLVNPKAETAATLNIHATIELSESGVLGSKYTLDGELQLAYPELNG